MRKVVVLQARLGSSRYPKRVLADLSGKPVFAHIIERLQAADLVDEICVAIPSGSGDDELADALKEQPVTVVRGKEYDLVSRYIQAAYQTGADLIVKAKADDPLICYETIDRQLSALLDNPELEFVTTGGMPAGTAPESFKLKTLEKLDFLAKHEDFRTNVSRYVYRHPGPFVLEELPATNGLNRPDLKFSLDTAEDHKLLGAIYDELYTEGSVVELAAAIELVDKRPELLKLATPTIGLPAAS